MYILVIIEFFNVQKIEMKIAARIILFRPLVWIGMQSALMPGIDIKEYGEKWTQG